MWRDDGNRYLGERLTHLLSKQGVTRWLWIVGNSSDETEAVLTNLASQDKRITVLHYDSDVLGNEPNERLLRLSLTANIGLEAVRDDDDFTIIHESDLRSPDDIVPQFLAMQGDEPKACAGWVTLGEDYPGLFYDTYAYRRNGQRFVNGSPYHPVAQFEEPYEVDSAGSVLMFPSAALRNGLRLERGGMIEICLKLKEQGYRVIVNPKVHIIQPTALWTSSAHADY